MKILTITIDHFPQSGGVARYADGACRLFKDDMRVIADIDLDQSVKDAYRQEAPYEIEYEGFMRKGWPKWWEALQIIKEAKEDMIFVHHVLPLGLAAMLSSKPYVVFLHGMDFATASRHWRRRHVLRRVLRRARAVVANSQKLKDEVKDFAGVDAIRCYPQPWMIGSPDDRVARKHKFRLVSVARIAKRKGYNRVLEMLRDDPKMAATCSYTIVGKGEYSDELRRLIDEYGLEETVTFHETDATEAIRSGYENADLFVLPTMNEGGNKEGFGIVYLEAATYGVPTVAMNIPGVNEAVLHGQTGLLADDVAELHDCVERLMNDEDELQRLGQAALMRVSKEFVPAKIFQPLMNKIDYD